MKNKLFISLFICVLICFSNFTIARDVTQKEVHKIAQNFLTEKKTHQTKSLQKDVPLTLVNITEFSEPRSKEVFAYIAHVSPKGFLVISKYTDIEPVIAYSFRHNWCTDTSCSNILYNMLHQDMKLRKESIKSLPAEIIKENNKKWQNSLSERALKVDNHSFHQWPEVGTTTTGGLIETTWTQQSPYNDFCPIDPFTGNRCLVGCVATAMAQIINYHKYIGKLHLNKDDYYTAYGSGIRIDADSSRLNFPSFEKLNIYLDNIRLKYTNNLDIEDNSRSALNFACGILLKMNYSSESSSSWNGYVPECLKNKLGFYNAKHINLCNTFYHLLKSNIINGLPVQLGIFKPGEGPASHSVVLDGYNTDGFYHLNFGWGENSPDQITDAWYLLPENMGAGYSVVNDAVVNIIPNEDYQTNLTSDIELLLIPGCKVGEISHKSFILSNNGQTPIIIQYLVSSDNFSISKTTSTFSDSIGPTTILENDELIIYAQCEPDSIGPFEGDIIINYSIDKYLVIDLIGHGTPDSGTIINTDTTSGIWSKNNSPYHICGDIIVEKGKRLEILPGVEINFIGPYKCTIGSDAQLIAIGTKSDSIYFHGYNTSKKGWLGLEFLSSGSDDSLAYCVIKDCVIPEDNVTGAINIGFSSPTITNSRISNNRGTSTGAIFCGESSPEISFCLIENNIGSAIYCSNSKPKISYCRINGNIGNYGGGALHLVFASPTISNTLIYNNKSNTYGCGKDGGAVYAISSSAKFFNTTICDNESYGLGGGIYLRGGSHIIFKNSILWENHSVSGSILSLGNTDGSFDIVEFNFTDVDTTNTDWIHFGNPGNGGVVWGFGNICINPIFVDSNSRDYTLHDLSPCIDAGDPNDDFKEEPFPHGFRINMGAYGGTPFATLTTKTTLTFAPFPINFGEMSIGESKELKIYLKNGSPNILHINEIIPSDPIHLFILEGQPLSLESGFIDSINVIFTPSHLIQNYFNATITIKTDELSDQIIQVLALLGSCIHEKSVEGVWTKEKSPYNIYCDIEIPEEKSLIIKPGVRICFMGQFSLKVGKNSKLCAIGCETDSIKFYSSDSTYGWFGIDFEYSGDDDSLAYCIISEGRAIGTYPQDRGGAIYLNYTNPTIIHTTIKENYAKSHGGAIYCFFSNPQISYSLIEKNKQAQGGTLFFAHSSSIIENTIICNNKSTYRCGAIMSWNSSIEFVNDIISKNEAGNEGGAICLSSPNNHFKFINTIIWTNYAQYGSTLAFGADPNASNIVEFNYSDIDTTNSDWIHWGTPTNGEIIWNVGNIVKDPLFINGQKKTYVLKETSPCIDAGDPEQIYNDREDPVNAGFALWPAMGTIRSDMGAYGGNGCTNYKYNINKPGWYLLSFPFFKKENRVNSLFSSIKSAFIWNVATQKYEVSTVVDSLSGYWFSFESPFICSIEGYPIKKISMVGKAGWNLFASVSEPVSLSAITTDPPNSLVTVFGWNAETQSYENVQRLHPQNGYWFALLQECEVTINSYHSGGSIATVSSRNLPVTFVESFGSCPPPPPDQSSNVPGIAAVPDVFQLNQNYPNPFNPETTIKYQLPKSSHVELVIYNIKGQKIVTLVNEKQTSGYYQVKWNGINSLGNQVSTGIYFYKLQADDFQDIRKMVFIR